MLSQQAFELARRGVFPHDAVQFSGHLQSREVAGNICSASGHTAFSFEIHHWNRRFGRNSHDAPPNKLVQHDVAHDQNARLTRRVQKLPDPLL